jgi:hypothetical protein
LFHLQVHLHSPTVRDISHVISEQRCQQ